MPASPPYLLCIETTTQVCSVSLSRGEQVLAHFDAPKANDHAAQLLPLIAQVAAVSGVGPQRWQAVAVSRGPGSYTGLRIGASTAKGLCTGLDIPLIAIDSLQALAGAAWRAHQQQYPQTTEALLGAMIDARRMEVYRALYRSTDLMCLAQPEAHVLAPDSLETWYAAAPPDTPLLIAGDGVPKTEALWADAPLLYRSTVQPSALHLVPLALSAWYQNEWQSVAYFEPFYLKPANITQPRTPRQ